MNLIGAAIGGMLGALLGGAAWVGVGYATGYEVGWIAWGVGAAAGFGVALGGKGQCGAAGGVLAAVLAVASILVAKYIVVDLYISDALQGLTSANSDSFPEIEDREVWVSYICDQLIEARVAAGEQINWPAGVDLDTAQHESDYPKEIWRDAAARWDSMSQTAQRDYRDAAAASIAHSFNEAIASARSEGFFQSFSAFDLLFGFLAIATAFKLGSAELAKTEQ